MLSGGSASSSSPNTIQVNAGGRVGTVDGIAGTAISTGSGFTNVSNSGLIIGSINLGSTPGTITNNTGGRLYTGTIVVGGIVNSGVLNVGGSGIIATTTLTGGVTQTSAGTLGVDINSLASQKADLLSISSGTSIQGTIAPVASNLLPGQIVIVTAAGGVTLQAQTAPSLLINWNLGQSGNSVVLSPSSNFTPADVSLTRSESSLASFLTTAWNNADTQFAPTFARFSQIASASQYTSILDNLSARATQAQSIALANSSGAILSSAMSCPVFVDQGTLLGEGNCVWARVTGDQSNEWSNGDTPGFQVASATYRIGGQHAVAPDWYLGASFAAGHTWSTSSGGSSGYGTTFDGSVALKHTMGPWLFSGAFALASGAFHNNRVVNLPSIGTFAAVNTTLQSDPGTFLAGGRLRAAYDFAFDSWYVRPYGDLDVYYTHAPGFQESGVTGYALSVNSNSKTSTAVSPMVEFGGRYNVDQTTILRPYAAVGVSLLPNNTRFVDATFVGALPSDGTFRTFMKSPDVLGNFNVGVQLYREGGFEVKAEYGIKVGDSYLSQSGSGRVAYHF